MPERPEPPARVDLAVIGGGPGGAAAAVTAAREGMRVALLTTGPPRTARPGESLPPGGDVAVEEIFGPDGLEPGSHLPAYGTRSVWGSERVDDNEFVFNPFGSGWHLDRRVFDERLSRLAVRSGVRVVRRCQVRSAQRTTGGWELGAVASGARRHLRAGSLIDATGRAARIARTLGARRRRLDRLVAVMWVFGKPETEDTDSTVTVESTQMGWWYTAPVPRGRRIAAFVTDPQFPAARTARTNAGALIPARAPHAIAGTIRAAGYRTRSAPVVTDAGTGSLDTVCGDHWWAVGDAAVHFDPLSSQGILSALLTGHEAGLAAAGRASAGTYSDLCRTLLDDHVTLRTAFYASEERWFSDTFWTRRQGPLLQGMSG